MTLEDVKNYLRVSYDDDDGYLTNLMQVAEDYLVAGVTDYLKKKENDHFKARAEIFCHIEHRACHHGSSQWWLCLYARHVNGHTTRVGHCGAYRF